MEEQRPLDGHFHPHADLPRVPGDFFPEIQAVMAFQFLKAAITNDYKLGGNGNRNLF